MPAGIVGAIMPAGVSNSLIRSELGLLVVAFVLACGFYARADTLSGTVVDPQQLVVVGAKVSWFAETTLTHAKRTAEDFSASHGRLFLKAAASELCTPASMPLNSPLARNAL